MKIEIKDENNNSIVGVIEGAEAEFLRDSVLQLLTNEYRNRTEEDREVSLTNNEYWALYSFAKNIGDRTDLPV